MPTVQNENAEIYYEIHGDGPAIALVHGAGGNTLVWWQQVPYFASDYKVVNFDHRGWGQSKCAPEHRHARHFASDLRAVLDDAGIEKATLVCQSMGGWTGMQFTLQNPERVSCLVLAGTPAGIQTPKIIEVREQRARDRAQNAGNATGWNQSHWALAPDAFQRDPERAFLYSQMSSLNAPIGDTGTSELTLGPDDFKGYTTPTLLIAGEQDRIFPPELLEEVASVVPGVQIHKIPISGHSTYFEAPDQFNRIAGEFIAKYGS